jgi:hypothetical protein
MLASGKSAHFNALLADLSASTCRTALVTSEDFSLLHARPDALQVMADGLRSVGYRPIVVVYLRPQAVFAESMYVERIKHDYVRPLPGFVQTVLETGSYLPDGTVIHMEFQYTRLLEPFVRVFGKESVVVRPYEAQKGVAHIFEDFLSIVRTADPDFARTPMTLQVHAPRANDSLKFLELLYTAYASLHKGKIASPGTIGNDLVAMVRQIDPEFPEEALVARFALITREETLEFLRKFGPDNLAVEREFGIRVAFTNEQDIGPAGDALWERARLDRQVFDALLERWMSEPRNERPSDNDFADARLT